MIVKQIMLRVIANAILLGGVCWVLPLSPGEVAGQGPRKTGSVIGVVTNKGNQGDRPDASKAWIEIKAAGEQDSKGRRYWSRYRDQTVIADIRAVAVGARVQITWIDGGDSKDITKFEVLKSEK